MTGFLIFSIIGVCIFAIFFIGKKTINFIKSIIFSIIHKNKIEISKELINKYFSHCTYSTLIHHKKICVVDQILINKYTYIYATYETTVRVPDSNNDYGYRSEIDKYEIGNLFGLFGENGNHMHQLQGWFRSNGDYFIDEQGNQFSVLFLISTKSIRTKRTIIGGFENPHTDPPTRTFNPTKSRYNSEYSYDSYDEIFKPIFDDPPSINQNQRYHVSKNSIKKDINNNYNIFLCHERRPKYSDNIFVPFDKNLFHESSIYILIPSSN